MRYLANGSIRVPEDAADLATLYDWVESQHTLAVDWETTGLDIYSASHRARLLALATPKEAWTVPMELSWVNEYEVIRRLLDKRLIMHNASYDIQVTARHYGEGISKKLIEVLWYHTRDTKILAHQIDPRGREEGGIGQSLEELVKHYMPEYQKLGDDLKNEFKRLKQSGAIRKSATFADMWRELPIDNELYNIYAGTDAILTARLFQDFREKVNVNSELTKDDHKTAMIASLMDANGFLLDIDYTTKLRDNLLEEEFQWKAVALSYGLENINSPQQVVEILAARGLKPDQLTPKGNPKVDKVFLNAHRDDPLVEATIEGKRAGKWRTTWVEKFLNACDQFGRVHPSTNTLRARTARFSITGIPAQTLPSGDSMVRSCFVADTDEVIVGVDYAQQELRFAAAKAPDARMIKAFRNNEDLHYITAETAWPGRGLEMRKYGKGGNFATVYGGGARALMEQFDMTYEQAAAVIAAIRKAYPGLKILGDRLGLEAEKNGYITTWTGRKLPVDQHRLYAALNYYIQSGCRDITARAMIRLYDAGYVDHMRLAIHDEILFSLPNEQEMIDEIVSLMSTKVGPLQLPAEAKVGSRSWGSLYEQV
jgi:DNA polymerase I-like protein with 3'-5' exonuclease and polymerase domains